MAAFDSIVNVEEWISDHYLTTDETKGESFGKQVANRIKEWNQLAQESGASPFLRFTAARHDLQLALSTLDPNGPDARTQVDKTHRLISDALGYGQTSKLIVERGEQQLSFMGIASPTSSVTVIAADPISGPEDVFTTSTRGEVSHGDKVVSMPAAKLVSEIFLSENPPTMVVITAAPWVILAERESWPLGRFLAIDLGLAIERNDLKSKGEMQRVAVSLMRENTERAADGTSWWAQTIEQSREHAVKVSEELRGAVKASIEIIGNDVLDRHRQQQLPTENIDGNELAKQSLRYLYRILFLLFAEASPELNILPTGAQEYDEGYGLSRLRDQILSEPVTDRARRGTHLYQSLDLLFGLVDHGHDPHNQSNPEHDNSAGEEGLEFRNLSADLFQPSATSIIDSSGLSNHALHRVLEHLLLTRQRNGQERGFISYATLGVTELGQVYEGLMSYTGFIAREDLLEVAPKGDSSKGSWVVPEHRVDGLPGDCFVQIDQESAEGGIEKVNRRHKAGAFVFRQSSRDRERSASFYSPQVLTEFTVGQAIEVLQEEGRLTSADDVLSVSICEPAMGSGAFAVEAVRQLAELYLKLRERELDSQVPAAERTVELQKVKAYIALHQVYGVDLNKTAVELAEISLWLDTMTADLKAPWFGLHLRHGNSLIGTRRATFATKDLKTRNYLAQVPRRDGVQTLASAIDNPEVETKMTSRVHHFLVPSNGWGATADAKDLKDIVGDEQKALKAWRKSLQKGLTAQQIKQLQGISHQVERLWQLALVRLRIAEDQARRDIDLWGKDTEKTAKNIGRQQIEAELFRNADGAYQRLRLVMNAWNALWFWPLTEVVVEHGVAVNLPDIDEWIFTLRDIIGSSTTSKVKTKGQYLLGFSLQWEELDTTEKFDIELSMAKPADQLDQLHPWLKVARKIAKEQAFFHWDLDFASVMSRGGFDLQVGNPPWVRPRTDVDALLSEHDPWFNLAHKPTQAQKRQRRELLTGRDPESKTTVVKGTGETVATAAVLGDLSSYPHLKSQQPDLYRGFMERTWANAADSGVVSLIHPESHFTEKKAASLRSGAYRRLRRHWQFVNELKLFDIDNHVTYGIHVYSTPRTNANFLNATSLYHPQTALDSLHHNGTGELPGFKDNAGHWDLRPHRDRIINVNEDELKVWKSILEDPKTPLLETRMVYTVNSQAAAVLKKLSEAPRMKSLGLEFSSGWHETADKKAGYFDSSWQHPDTWADVILQGPHLGVSTPMVKQPNATMKSNKDWSEVDLEAMPEDFIPATAYLSNRDIPTYDADYGYWGADGEKVPVASTFRIAWREFAATTGFRTLYPAIIPPGTKHIHAVNSCRCPNDLPALSLIGAVMSSILADYFVRSAGTGHIFNDLVRGMPFDLSGNWADRAARLYLRLNCLTSAYAPLWEEITGEEWTVDTPLRLDEQRRQAQIEIDAIVALSLGISADELCMIYRTQFPVMRRYDQEDHFDAHGRKVAKDVLKLQKKLKADAQLSEQDRTWIHPQSKVSYTFEYPFRVLDREADLRAAYAKYQGMI
ncbi:Eco57I restriction-modification methylase domain-containing protein [Corynebacterium alimapuense]|uniref:site-specific DNA-methyltransferase (adenine-specific) n=1 Tax=Corynebacterium alimapuense TaxID=1576874 RepID=A0A3M8K896_9CORY|nr:DNA methyltransferase [Corynebacterium alimapuense]RNE49366.1 restriction endonuclease subunit M [Corynebacterium alimapuense]